MQSLVVRNFKTIRDLFEIWHLGPVVLFHFLTDVSIIRFGQEDFSQGEEGVRSSLPRWLQGVQQVGLQRLPDAIHLQGLWSRRGAEEDAHPEVRPVDLQTREHGLQELGQDDSPRVLH